MDANQYALEVKPAAKSLGVAIRSAQWLGKGKAKPVTTEAVSSSSSSSPPRSLRGPEPEPEPVIEEEAPLPLVADPSITDASCEAEEPGPLPAAVIPAPPAPEIEALVNGQEVVIVLGDRRYRIRGLVTLSPCSAHPIGVKMLRLGVRNDKATSKKVHGRVQG